VKDAWGPTLQEVNKRSKRIWGLLNPSRPVRFDGDALIVEVQSAFHQATMTEERNRSVLADALQSALGIAPPLTFVPRGTDMTASEPPAAPVAGRSSQPARTSSTRPPDAPAVRAVPDEVEHVDIEATTPIEDSEHDPVEMLKRGLGAEVVEERTPS